MFSTISIIRKNFIRNFQIYLRFFETKSIFFFENYKFDAVFWPWDGNKIKKQYHHLKARPILIKKGCVFGFD